jgi:hypothetical protein
MGCDMVGGESGRISKGGGDLIYGNPWIYVYVNLLWLSVCIKKCEHDWDAWLILLFTLLSSKFVT